MPEQQHDFEFEFVGLLGLKDPVRPNVKGAIDECCTAGIVEQFNRKDSGCDDCYYEAQFRGQYCYLHRSDYGRLGPICRLTYTGRMDGWKFAIFKWSSEMYDPNEWRHSVSLRWTAAKA